MPEAPDDFGGPTPNTEGGEKRVKASERLGLREATREKKGKLRKKTGKQEETKKQEKTKRHPYNPKLLHHKKF